ncbi:MAG: gcvT [Alphaproteobacteria bacterium]|nr:gcvT [Alphaproteobacteria bacterium]
MSSSEQPLLKTPLHALHVELGAKMVPFAGYDMPVQYPSGILTEHLHTRAEAGLFDVSHMGQCWMSGPQAADIVESLTPGDIKTLAPGQQRYTQFTLPNGGIADDLMVSNAGDMLLLVVNAACKQDDFARLRQAAQGRARFETLDEHGLLALQGPHAVAALERVVPGVAQLKFMTGARFVWEGAGLYITRSGYTGEDGCEISVPADKTEALARALLAQPEVKPIGLGARDSLRLEAGLCLYGHDIDTESSPIEAGLLWSIPKHRRNTGGFPGDTVIIRQIAGGPPRRRVGILPEGRAPAREGTEIVDAAGTKIGVVTSGGFAPSLNRPIAMGYVGRDFAEAGTKVGLLVRGKALPAEIVKMPFVKKSYHKV